MKNLIPLLVCVGMLSACANGPTHDYYNPQVVGADFKKPITIIQVEDVKAEVEKCRADGYTIIGQTLYSGKYPETVELIAQAKRVGANHIVYHSKFVPAAPGSWHFGFSSLGGGTGASGGTDRGVSDNDIVFMGK